MSSPAPAPLGLSLRGAQRIRRVTVVTVLLLALAAAVMSFAGLRELALRAGYPPALAWLLPLIVDGLVITGSLGVVAASLVGLRTWYPWMLTWLGVIASVVGNVAVAQDDWLSRAVHATPPITFALAIEGLIRIYRVGAEALVAQQGPTGSPTPTSQPPTIAEDAPGITEDPVERAAAPDTVAAPGEQRATARERLKELLVAEPDINGSDAARRLDIDPSHARKLLRELRSEDAQAFPLQS